MRITQSMLASNSLRNLSDSYLKMGKLQNQLSTGKKITKPSDDPVVAMKGMFYRSDLTSVDQYKRNLSELHLWMDNSEAGMDQANSGLQRVRELVIEGQNGTLSPEDRKAIAVEVGQLKQDLVKTANTQVAGRYIYHGTDVMNPPVEQEEPPVVATNITDPTQLKLINNYQVEVSKGVNLKANVNPGNVFSQDLFNVVGDIQTALETNNTSGLDGSLGKLDKVMDTMSAERADLGARSNRLDMVEDRLGQQDILANQVLSDNEDASIEKVIMDMTTQESVHRAALSVGSKIIQPTLMDFLR
ncbi:flagellar hook-associated protein FlgL [Neobacillus sp. PS3-40]|uniref:flagellar hook-associated protein FlgL n=1 Tax=Neobacillus sp. PS3-40 TaxID=3070679 RepID=UPI0027DEB141|nr:flagellar hook-associated protein FlgL [Neobacillus sp. PS3-40]WML46089.1 flagellar hook-associated protein FlgL [Neobacillus sp. PS3-40]